jgi:hypothetical protein
MMRRRGPGLVRGVARTAVVAGTASAVSGRVQRRQEERWAGQEQEAATEAQKEAQPAVPEPLSSAPAVEGYVAELEDLARLRNQGIITEEEFQTKKRQVLGI